MKLVVRIFHGQGFIRGAKNNEWRMPWFLRDICKRRLKRQCSATIAWKTEKKRSKSRWDDTKRIADYAVTKEPVKLLESGRRFRELMRYAYSKNVLLPCVEAFIYLWTPPLSSRADGPLFQVNRLAFLGEGLRSMCRVVFIISGSLESRDETLFRDCLWDSDVPRVWDHETFDCFHIRFGVLRRVRC